MISEQTFVDTSDRRRPARRMSDLQRLKLEKLMENFDKPVLIPERPKEKNLSQAPDFVRNVMGSSAGAGSGEFHVYRHLRRKEYARQKYIQLKSERELLDEEYKKKLEENARLAEEKTAKKRAKRLKKKEKMKNRNKKPKTETQTVSEVGGSSSEGDLEEDKKRNKGSDDDNETEDNEKSVKDDDQHGSDDK